MNRKIKTLGATLLAAAALGAVAVGPAQGTSGGHFVSDGEPTTLDIAADNLLITYSGISVECTHTTFHAPDVSETETLITVTPTYTDCYLGEHEPANEMQVTMNSCDYEFTIGEFASEDNTVHVECGDEDEIELHTQILGECTIDIPEQTSLTGVSYSNEEHEGVHDVSAEITVDEITYTRTDNGALFGCVNLLGKHGTDFKLTGDMTITGTNASEEATAITAVGSND